MSQLRSTAIVPLALALAALAGAGCGSEETRPAAPPAAVPAPPPAPEAAAPAPAAQPAPPAPSGAAMEWTGELPSDFPGDVPRYPGAKVASAQGTGDLGVAVTFDSPDSTDAVAKFYADSLASMGWQTQTQQTEEGAMIFADKDDRILQAMVHAGGQGTLVDMIIAPAE
jgi:hypothetical protein